jgi:hypothetical protein
VNNPPANAKKSLVAVSGTAVISWVKLVVGSTGENHGVAEVKLVMLA